jgi:hypothetical protein
MGPRRDTYRQILAEIDSLLEGLDDPVTAMASAASVIHSHLPYASWTGFYRVVAPELLRVGPYQGPVGCLEIPFGRGVCGAAARERLRRASWWRSWTSTPTSRRRSARRTSRASRRLPRAWAGPSHQP